MQNLFREVSPAEQPHLHRALDELCAKAGIEKPTLCFINDTSHLGEVERFQLEHMAGAMHFDKPRIVLGEKIRHIFDHTGPDSAVSDELKAVIAHEIGHIKYGDVKLYKVLPLRLSPILGMVAGAAGAHYYLHAKEKAAAARAAGVAEANIQASMQQDWEKSDQHVAVPQMQEHYKVAKIIAGSLLGLAAGTTIYALGHRHVEFRADRTAMELMGSGEPIGNALRKLESAFKHDLHSDPQLVEELKKENQIARFYQKLMHPPMAERLARADSWGRG